MTLALADAALLAPLCAFTAHDISTRTIPLWLTLPAFALAVTGWLLGLWPYSLLAALVGFLAFRLASLPAGDQKAMAVACGFLGPGFACLAVALSICAGCWLLLLGRWRDWRTPEWPFFPWVAGSVMVARMLG